ncbi:MAG: hypothetical protein R3330_19995, partial [Saprospiraceae bacterium]|nr:hypothetical protein [Saprospiraceae bacterium]
NPHPGHLMAYTFNLPNQGGGYWASEDVVNATVNPLGSTADGYVRLPDLNSAGLGNLTVTLHLADNRYSGGTSNMDGGEAIEVQAAFDANIGGTDLLAGTYTTVGRFIAASDGSLRQDTNLDGSSNDAADTGSPELTPTFTPYTFDILGSGNTLSVQVVVIGTSGSEEVAFDSVKVDGAVVGDPPVLANIEGTVLTYTEGDPATQITNTITVSDNDDTDLESATIQLTTGYHPAEDVLSVIGTLPTGITAGAFNAGDGSLTLSGTASLADYQTALRQIGYENTAAPNPSIIPNRTVAFQVNDGMSNSNIETRDIDVQGVVAAADMPYCEDFNTDGEGV